MPRPRNWENWTYWSAAPAYPGTKAEDLDNLGTHANRRFFPVEDWDRTFAVNMKGVFLCNRAAAPLFRAKNAGRIVNISSVAGRRGVDFLPAYAATKAGVISFTQSMALLMAPNHVNVNAVCPGVIYTPMWQRGSQILAKGHPMFAGSGIEAKSRVGHDG